MITLQDLFVARPPDEEQAVSRGSRLLTPLQCAGLGALPREDGGERSSCRRTSSSRGSREKPIAHLRLGGLQERAVRFAFVILAALAAAVPASAANRLTAVDVTGYPGACHPGKQDADGSHRS